MAQFIIAALDTDSVSVVGGNFQVAFVILMGDKVTQSGQVSRVSVDLDVGSPGTWLSKIKTTIGQTFPGCPQANMNIELFG